MGFKWNAAGTLGGDRSPFIVIISSKDNGIIIIAEKKQTHKYERFRLNTAHNRLHSIEAAAREARLALGQPRVRLHGTL